MTKLIINRSSSYSNKFRAIKILLNGKEFGSIKNGGSESFSIDPGQYTLKSKIDWCGSNTITFDIKEGENKHFKICSSNPLLGLFYLIFSKNKYLNLSEIK